MGNWYERKYLQIENKKLISKKYLQMARVFMYLYIDIGNLFNTCMPCGY